MTQLQITAFGDPSVLRLNPSSTRCQPTAKCGCASALRGQPHRCQDPGRPRLGGGPEQGQAAPTPGYDVAGVVEKIGPGVTALAEGDRVCGMVGFPLAAGGYGESVVAREEELVRLEQIGLRQGAALPLAGLTAWQGLFEHGALKAGQRVLIWPVPAALAIWRCSLPALTAPRWSPRRVATTTASCTGWGPVGWWITMTQTGSSVGQVDLVLDLVGARVARRRSPASSPVAGW